MDQITLNFWALFYAIACAQGLFVAFLLLKTKKGMARANRYLSALVFILSVYLFDLFLGRSNLLYQYPDLIYFAAPLWYLFAPLAYFYAISVLDDGVRINWTYTLHFVPFLFVFANQIPFYLLPPEIKLEVWVNKIPPPGGLLFNYLQALIAPVQIFFYALVVSRRIIRKDRLAEEDSRIGAAHMGWLKLMFYLLFGFAVVRFGIVTHYFLTGVFIPFLADLRFFVFSAIIYAVAYSAVIEPERIFFKRLMPRKEGLFVATKAYEERLVALVENERLYLNPQLKYTDLAQRLDISARFLTEVLNKGIGLTFNEFINSYRVREVKKRMASPEHSHLSLLALALDSGFSSKSSFNRIFKKHTGATPSQFLAAKTAKMASVQAARPT